MVSRSPVLAMGLSSTGHDVVDLRPDEFGAWIGSPEQVDALVLDLDSPALSRAAVENVRGKSQTCPILLVASTHPSWDDLDIRELPGTTVLSLPIDRNRLVAATEQLLAPHAPEHVLDERTATPSQATPASPEAAPLSAVPRTRRSSLPKPESKSTLLNDLEALRPAPKHAAPTRPADSPGPVTHPRPSHRKSSSRARRRSAEPPQQRQGSGGPPDSRRTAEAGGAVRDLIARRDQLHGLRETAAVVILDAVERTKADAGALLAVDGSRWRVAAGVGLRPLELRSELGAGSWLISEIAVAGRAVLIEESDIARERLQGAPLASWRHLLAAPMPDVPALTILARREDPPFDESDLRQLVTLGTEASELVRAALDVRQLARTLQPFLDDTSRS